MSDGSKELIALDNVTAGYGDSVVLEGISLKMNEGDSLALLGRNGVGKSTLLVTMMGLPGGEQQMLAIARALMTNPKLLLLDEPMEGLAPIIVQELLRVIRALIAEEGLSVIVVEQHARLALSLTQRAIVLDRGRIVHDSDSSVLMEDKETLDRLVAVA